MSTLLLNLVLLLTFSLPSEPRAQEPAPARLEYALDEQTELTLEPGTDEKIWSMDLRHYGSATVGQDLYLMGDLKFVMDDAYEYRSEEGGKMQIVRIERTPHAGSPSNSRAGG